jgi:nucleotide-binding universal stress UspA family protein
MYSPIMIGVDGSKYAEVALKKAIQMAKFHGAKLVIASVFTYPPEMGNILDKPESLLNEVSLKLKRLLEGYKVQAIKAGVKDVEIKVLTTLSPFMSVGAMLVIEAEKMGCALIVVGTKGMTGIKRTLLGSVADYVVKNAHCDVYVVRSNA